MIRVAIAEDDFRVAGIHEKFLSQIDDLQVVGKAMNGKDTLKLLNETEVDLLLLDIYMPDILGTDLLPEIRSSYPSMDIIVITAATDVEMVKNSLGYGVFDFIIKPLKMERFLETMKKYKHKKDLLDAYPEVRQEEVDQILMSKSHHSRQSSNHELPKGVDPLTLEKVKDIIRAENSGVTAEETGEKMGASRTTARRYLEYLTSTGEVKAELEYGIVGRPERIYIIS
ncbi:two-component system, CitB family, response regulator CitT [Lentibacillus halodurans]|uniref:Two-component system, CitB family, response regulator CitT n=1 Tax=Lentibacillus halodurans TaxID=237679 RepID=A0A1I0Z8K7_9BACI|nr:response regulator [Lentibacillus halodurans]SFB21687.1 two-component system, CitB family, response regulator CitT [Lentibacillus halodurans]